MKIANILARIMTINPRIYGASVELLLYLTDKYALSSIFSMMYSLKYTIMYE